MTLVPFWLLSISSLALSLYAFYLFYYEGGELEYAGTQEVDAAQHIIDGLQGWSKPTYTSVKVIEATEKCDSSLDWEALFVTDWPGTIRGVNQDGLIQRYADQGPFQVIEPVSTV